MSEELLSNDRRMKNNLPPPGIEPLTSWTINTLTEHSATRTLSLLCCNRLLLAATFISEWEQ